MSQANQNIFAAYLRFWLGLVAVLLLMCGVGCFLGYKYGIADFGFQKLYLYQIKKLAEQPQAEVIFLGDSSLGNAIDATYWRELTGQHALNLALTAEYGYSGTNNMLRRVLAQGAKPREIVIMHTTGLLARQSSALGYLLTIPDGEWPFARVRLHELFRAYLSYEAVLHVIRGIFKTLTNNSPPVILGDYILQGLPNREALDRAAVQQVFLPHTIQAGQWEDLKSIGASCAAAGVNCVYAHGPLIAAICERSAAYLHEVNDRIRAAGLRVLDGSPYCMPMNEVGDSEDHVRPAMRQQVTRYYQQLLTSQVPPEQR